MRMVRSPNDIGAIVSPARCVSLNFLRVIFIIFTRSKNSCSVRDLITSRSPFALRIKSSRAEVEGRNSNSRNVIAHVASPPRSFISMRSHSDVESALRAAREIFDRRRRDAAVSFISRQEQDPRGSFRPRTGPSRDVIVAHHLSSFLSPSLSLFLSRLPPLRASDIFLAPR